MHDIDFKTIHSVLANLVMESIIFPYSKEIFLLLLFPSLEIDLYITLFIPSSLRRPFINFVLFVLKIFPKLHIGQLFSLMES